VLAALFGVVAIICVGMIPAETMTTVPRAALGKMMQTASPRLKCC